jgi:outer membrane protein insertion porin family
MRLSLALLLSFLIAQNIYSQTIKSIKYEGVVHMSESVALGMLDFSVGDELDEKKVDEAISKYFKQGYFTDVYAKIEEGELTFFFVEKPLISKIELKGYKENDEDIKDTVIQIKRGSLYDEKKLQAAKKRLMDAMSQDGKIDSVVEIQTEKLENGSIKVTFVANEGEEIIIEKLRYSGVEKLDHEEFDDVIANKEKQWMGWFYGRNDGKMQLQDLAYDHLRIKDYYMQHGFLDAKVEQPFVKADFNNYTAFMSYVIEEGEVYNISGVSVSQTEHVIDDEKIKEVISLEIGEPFNIQTFRDDSQKIKRLIADLSYAFVQVIPDLRKDKENNTVEVVFKVVPGDKVKIRNVLISGNNRTLDRIIRRELYLGPGDMYSLTDLTDSRNSLGRLGFFEGHTIEERRVDNKTMDLIVKVKEAPTGNIQIGGGYGSYGGFLVNIAVNDRNIWGSGIDVGVQAEKSETTRNYSFNISNQRLNDSDFSGNFSIHKSSYDYNDYTTNSEGISVGIGHRFTRHINGYLGYGFSSHNYENVDDAIVTNLYYFEDYAKSSISMSINFDNTDDYYLPRNGHTVSQVFEKAGIGSDANYLKSRTKFNIYRGLEDYVGFDAIFRYKSRYYLAVDTGYLPVSEKFYMGGFGSVRGYESYSIAPLVTQTSESGYVSTFRTGANQTFSNSFEVSFPLVEKAKMRLVTYLDWGFIGDDSLDEFSRGGYGAGLEWFSPVGPIQLMFAKPLNDQEGDRTSSFEFTMGQRF